MGLVRDPFRGSQPEGQAHHGQARENDLSLQSHERRAENWVIVQGQALFTLGEKHTSLGRNQAVFIPEKAKHRMENPGQEELVFIEVQTGSYLGEDDITRFQDDFDRC